MNRGPLRDRWRSIPESILVLSLAVSACGPLGGGSPSPDGEPVSFTVPSGSTFGEITDTLVRHDLVGKPGLFRLYARIRGLDTQIRAGEYALKVGTPWGEMLDDLVTGRVRTVAMTVPEGFTLDQIAERIAPITGGDPDSIRIGLRDATLAAALNVPGPGLEGYLFPDTYRFASGVSLEQVLRTMVDQYESVWIAEWESRMDSLGMTRREAMTLASIVQAEARVEDEMPTIASVYHNRLKDGWLLQADPTVQYALGGRRERLLYAAIDSVTDHPYNTYTFPGLPPGPIGAPGLKAIEATLYPAESDFMFFVARPDGSHVFTRTLAEHNRAKAASRREIDRIRRENAQSGS